MHDELRNEVRSQVALAFRQAALTIENALRDRGATPGADLNATVQFELDELLQEQITGAVAVLPAPATAEKVKLPEPRLIKLQIERQKPGEPKTVKAKLPEPRIIKVEVTR